MVALNHSSQLIHRCVVFITSLLGVQHFSTSFRVHIEMLSDFCHTRLNMLRTIICLVVCSSDMEYLLTYVHICFYTVQLLFSRCHFVPDVTVKIFCVHVHMNLTLACSTVHCKHTITGCWGDFAHGNVFLGLYCV